MLDVQNIAVRYGSAEILRDVSFELIEGEIIAVLGPNGAGKTTLVRALNGTVPLSSGRIALDGNGLSSFSRRQIAQAIAVVAQENETKFPVTVMQFVLAGRFARGAAFGWETSDDIQIAEDALRSCDLMRFGDRMMNELSGGERQRVVLARALATEAKILLLDEPTANLDLANQALMFGLVRKRCDLDANSAVVITHDLNLASAFADRIMLLKAGRIIAIGSPEAVLRKESLHEVFDVQVLLDRHPASKKVRVTTMF